MNERKIKPGDKVRLNVDVVLQNGMFDGKDMFDYISSHEDEVYTVQAVNATAEANILLDHPLLKGTSFYQEEVELVDAKEESGFATSLFSDWKLGGVTCVNIDWTNRVFTFLCCGQIYVYDENNPDQMNMWNRELIDSVTEHIKKKALERHIEKTPVNGDDDQDDITCPTCGYALEAMDADDYAEHHPYCPQCGQALKW